MAAFVSGGVTLAATDGGARLRRGAESPASEARRRDPGRDSRPPAFPPERRSPGCRRGPGRGGHEADADPGGSQGERVVQRSRPARLAVRRRRPRPGHAARAQIHGQRVAWRSPPGGRPWPRSGHRSDPRSRYLLHGDAGYRSRDLWGNGTHAFTVARQRRGGTPPWRWDSKALGVRPRRTAPFWCTTSSAGANHRIPPACGMRTAGCRRVRSVRRARSRWPTRGASARGRHVGQARRRCLHDGRSGRPSTGWLGAATCSSWEPASPCRGSSCAAEARDRARHDGTVTIAGPRRLARIMAASPSCCAAEQAATRVVTAATPRFAGTSTLAIATRGPPSRTGAGAWRVAARWL